MILLSRKSNDPRSYRLDSTKLLNTGFSPKKTVNHAITEIIDAYQQGKLDDRRISITLPG